jgi:hypothetical protein
MILLFQLLVEKRSLVVLPAHLGYWVVDVSPITHVAQGDTSGRQEPGVFAHFPTFQGWQTSTHGNWTLFRLSKTAPEFLAAAGAEKFLLSLSTVISGVFGLAPWKEAQYADNSPVDRKPKESLYLSALVWRMKSTNSVRVEAGLSSHTNSSLQKSVWIRKPSSARKLMFHGHTNWATVLRALKASLNSPRSLTSANSNGSD